MRYLLLYLFFCINQFNIVAQPSYDDCNTAFDLGEAPVCPTDIFNNIDATESIIFSDPGDNIPSCWTNVLNDVWFLFTTPVDGSYLDFSITVGGAVGGPNNMPMIQPQVAVYRGDCLLDELSELVCAEYVPGQSIVNIDIFGLDPATPYFIRINDFSASATPNWGDFMICVDSISNVVEVLASATPDSICNGAVTQLNLTGSDNVDVYSWEPAFSLSDPNSETPNAFPTSTTTYTVTATNFGDNLIINGDFEMGDTGFTTDYNLGTDSLPIQPSGPLFYEGTYGILNNPTLGHSAFASCGDHTTGSGNMMVINGSGTAGESIWCQSVLVEQNTDYQFSAWVTSVVGNNPANLQFSINGLLLGTPFAAPFITCDWQPFSATWNSGVTLTAEICITNQNINLGGNDFAIDDINFSTFSEGESSVTVYVSDPTITISNQSDATCTGICDGFAEVSVSGGFTASGYTYLWSDGQTTAAATGLCAGAYNIEVTDDLGCTQTQTIVISEEVFSAAVNQIAGLPCDAQQDADAAILINGGTEPFTINWSSGGMGTVEEGLMNGMYSVTVEDINGCTSINEFTIELFEGIIPAEINNSQSDTICLGETITLIASGGNTGNFEWDNGATTPSITIAPEEETTYSVSTFTTGQNLIVNGDFEQGNVGFTSGHNFIQLPSNGMCQGCYGIGPLPPSLWTQCADHTTGTGNQMVFNAATVGGLNSWCQTVMVSSNTDYTFSFWGQTINNGNPANLSVIFDNVPNTGSLQLGASCDWQQFSTGWNSGVLTSVEICINNLVIAASGNDLALDDISFVPLCPVVAEKTIYVSTLTASIVQQTDIGCDALTGSAGVFAEGGFFPYNFIWDDGSTQAINNNLTAGIHTVTVTDVNAYCEEVLQVEINEAAIPEITMLLVTQATCDPINGLDVLPGSILVGMDGGIPPYTFSIDNGLSMQSDPLFENLEAGSYTILATDATECEVIASAELTEVVPPVVDIASEAGTNLCEATLLLSIETIADYDSLIWSTGEMTPAINITETGSYSITIFDEHNCQATAVIDINECGAYEIPNAFTPDGDGVNDGFGIISFGDVRLVEMVIYNRWGEEVYKGTGRWNGTYEGQAHPTDVFLYVITVEVQGVQEVRKGDLTLIR